MKSRDLTILGLFLFVRTFIIGLWKRLTYKRWTDTIFLILYAIKYTRNFNFVEI